MGRDGDVTARQRVDGELLATCISCGGACDVQTVPGGGGVFESRGQGLLYGSHRRSTRHVLV